jgi:two-component system alkaline phosphatase synthesis response regulator PhoP
MPLILVVDDDELLVQLVEHQLRHRGFEVITAGDGDEALVLAEDKRPDLIVLDCMMPTIDGFTVLIKLSENPTTAQIPVIMLTARKTEDDVLRGLGLGARDYLVKPFMPEELAARVTSALGLGTGRS